MINLRAQFLLSFGSTINNPSTPQASQIIQHQQLPHTVNTSSSIRLLAGSHVNAGSANNQPQSAQLTGPSSTIAAVIQASTMAVNGAQNSTSPTVNGTGSQWANTPQIQNLNYFLANPHLFNSAGHHATNLLASQSNNFNNLVNSQSANNQTSKSPNFPNNVPQPHLFF